MTDKICPQCKLHPLALNYHRAGRAHYRSLCISCTHKNKKARQRAPNWFRAGYRKTERCDKCGFKFKFPDQSNVYYVDGNEDNTNWLNLKTICLNCQQEIKHATVKWRPGGILPDF